LSLISSTILVINIHHFIASVIYNLGNVGNVCIEASLCQWRYHICTYLLYLAFYVTRYDPLWYVNKDFYGTVFIQKTDWHM
jgi:hypothetical protein